MKPIMIITITANAGMKDRSAVDFSGAVPGFLVVVPFMQKILFIKSVCLLDCKRRGATREGYGFQIDE